MKGTGKLTAKLLQGSWTRAVDLDTCQAISPRAPFADPPDNPCVQAVHPRKEAFGNDCLPEVATSTPVGEDEELGVHIFIQFLRTFLLFFSPF